MPAQTKATKSRSARRPRSQARARAAQSSDIHVENGVVRRGAAKGRAAKGRAPNRKSKRARKRALTASSADRYDLYQRSVQSPDEDCAFFARVYKSLRGKDVRHLREDFCGTALVAATWIKRNPRNTAEGFDIDPEPLAWGIEHNLAPLGERARRCTLHLKDVRKPSAKAPDVRIATNFSYWSFTRREDLLAYFKSAYEDLRRDGIFVLDIYGGPDALKEGEEKRDIEGRFTYVWDQVHYHPATAGYKAHIHFRFRDGTEYKRAFSYDWRLWFLTEVLDVLTEAGFASVETYWEGTDSDGESGNGVYRRSKKGENCDAWVTYLVALK